MPAQPPVRHVRAGAPALRGMDDAATFGSTAIPDRGAPVAVLLKESAVRQGVSFDPVRWH